MLRNPQYDCDGHNQRIECVERSKHERYSTLRCQSTAMKKSVGVPMFRAKMCGLKVYESKPCKPKMIACLLAVLCAAATLCAQATVPAQTETDEYTRYELLSP